MRKKFLAVITILLAVVLVVNGWFLVNHFSQKSGSLPEKETSGKELLPLEKLELSGDSLFSDHVIVLDVKNDRVLFEKDADGKTRPASLAKIMTALVIIENLQDFQERVEIPHDIYTYLQGSGIAAAGFEDGENPTVEDLLYGILYKSGAECCLTLAEKVAGSEEAFVAMMNEKAADIGLENTSFGNCIGLDSPACWTTARDLMKLTKYALENEHFRSIFASYSYTIAPTNKCSRERTIYNAAVKRFGSDRAGVFGGKLGNTDQAQLCLSAIAEINGGEYLYVSTHALRTQERYNPHVDDARTVYKAIEKQLEALQQSQE